MKNKLTFLVIILFSFLIINSPTFASTTNGTIDVNAHYAWGENIGWVDFSKVTVTDAGLGGSAYGENIGWIDLSTIINDGEGNLSGYAWGENIGWVDFSKTTIDNHGYFLGGAYGENIGWIVFNKDGANNVMTDWRPKSDITTHTGGGSSFGYCTPGSPCSVNNPVVVPPTTPPVVATPTTVTTQTTSTYSSTFTRILKYAMTGDDVKALQVFLNTHGYIIASTGAGSPLHETTFFGSLTKKAVIKFQIKNKLQPDGIVGQFTRGIINQLNK